MSYSTLSAFGIELLPTNFGLWSGPGWSGGQIISTANHNTTPEAFINLYNTVTARGFLDAGPKDHDLGYEYADRMYGGNSAIANPTAKNLTQFMADMDLLRNILNYQPPSYDFVAPADQDFIGAYYRQMLVFAFYQQAVWSYGLGPQMHKYWKDNFSAKGFTEPDIGDVFAMLKNGLPQVLFAQQWGTELPGSYGFEQLSTSGFVPAGDLAATPNMALTQQEMMLFNLHLSTGQQTLSAGYASTGLFPVDAYYGGTFNPKAAYVSTNYDNRLVIPLYDRNTGAFVFEGTINGKRVQMTLEGVVDKGGNDPNYRKFTYATYNSDGRIAEERTWTPNTQATDPKALETFGSRVYSYTVTTYSMDASGHWVGTTSAPSAVAAPTLPPLEKTDSAWFDGWKNAVLQQTWQGGNAGLAASDLVNFDKYVFTGYAAPSDYVALGLSGRSASDMASLAENSHAMAFALLHLEPFTRGGGDFAALNQNGELDLYDPATGRGQLTQRYLQDRAAFLQAVMNPTLNVNRPEIAADLLAMMTSPSLLAAGTALLNLALLKSNAQFHDTFYDYTLGADNTAKKILFGSDGDEQLTAGTQASSLYGGGGHDKLFGKGGNDYLEGGSGGNAYALRSIVCHERRGYTARQSRRPAMTTGRTASPRELRHGRLRHQAGGRPTASGNPA